MKMLQSVLPAVIVSLLAATHAAGAPLCKPELTIKDVTFSPIHNLQRTWTARIAVDAARCATESGRFQVNFVRLKEIAPDMDFNEQFSWTAGEIEVATDFSADEAVLYYTIAAAACPCREIRAQSLKTGE